MKRFVLRKNLLLIILVLIIHSFRFVAAEPSPDLEYFSFFSSLDDCIQFEETNCFILYNILNIEQFVLYLIFYIVLYYYYILNHLPPAPSGLVGQFGPITVEHSGGG